MSTRQAGQSPAASISSAHARPRPHPPLRRRTRALRHCGHRRRDDADLRRMAGLHTAHGGRARRARTRPRRPPRHHPPEPARGRDPALGLPDRGGGDHAGELARKAGGAGLRARRRRRAGGVLRAGVGRRGDECFACPRPPANRGGRRRRRQRRVRRPCGRRPRGRGTEGESGRRLSHALHLRHHGAPEGGTANPRGRARVGRRARRAEPLRLRRAHSRGDAALPHHGRALAALDGARLGRVRLPAAVRDVRCPGIDRAPPGHQPLPSCRRSTTTSSPTPRSRRRTCPACASSVSRARR